MRGEKKVKNYRWVIWDWNGTLLDDVDIAIRCVNDMLIKRGRPDRMDRRRYHDLIEMPIIRYYEKLFDLQSDPFSQLSVEFVESYGRYIAGANLMEGAREALQALKEAGCRQAILSSFESEQLERYITRFGIRNYFEEISGADNFRSESKTERGVQWANRLGISGSEMVVVGDLTHDFETALAMGADCILIANGHQNLTSLKSETAALTSAGSRTLLRFVSDIRQVPQQLRDMEQQATKAVQQF